MQAHTKNGENYESSAALEVSLPRLGLYDISFYVYMYCNAGEECVDANDYLSISSSDANQRISELATVKITDLQEQNKWERKVIRDFLVNDESQKEVEVNKMN